MKYLKQFENFSIGETIYVIMTDDEKYVFTMVRNSSAYFKTKDDITVHDIKYASFNNKKDAVVRMNYIKEIGGQIDFDGGSRVFALSDDELNSLVVVKLFMGVMDNTIDDIFEKQLDLFDKHHRLNSKDTAKKFIHGFKTKNNHSTTSTNFSDFKEVINKYFDEHSPEFELAYNMIANSDVTYDVHYSTDVLIMYIQRNYPNFYHIAYVLNNTIYDVKEIIDEDKTIEQPFNYEEVFGNITKADNISKLGDQLLAFIKTLLVEVLFRYLWFEWERP